MRLFISPGSPYARKCTVVVREKGLQSRVTEEHQTFPYKDEAFARFNPIGQVPALETDDGMVLTNSPVICAYLDSISGEPRLIPPEGPGHWKARRQEARADGIMEMAVKLVMEGRRGDNEKSQSWIGHWTTGLDRALDLAETEDLASEPLHMGVISLAIAGLYLDFRRPEMGWRATRPKLSALCDLLDQRPSFAETRPRA